MQRSAKGKGSAVHTGRRQAHLCPGIRGSGGERSCNPGRAKRCHPAATWRARPKSAQPAAQKPRFYGGNDEAKRHAPRRRAAAGPWIGTAGVGRSGAQQQRGACCRRAAARVGPRVAPRGEKRHGNRRRRAAGWGRRRTAKWQRQVSVIPSLHPSAGGTATSQPASQPASQGALCVAGCAPP